MLVVLTGAGSGLGLALVDRVLAADSGTPLETATLLCLDLKLDAFAQPRFERLVAPFIVDQGASYPNSTIDAVQPSCVTLINVICHIIAPCPSPSSWRTSHLKSARLIPQIVDVTDSASVAAAAATATTVVARLAPTQDIVVHVVHFAGVNQG